MEHKNQLVNFIINGENRSAEAFLTEIKERAACSEYAEAREKILLIEVAKYLNDRFPAFYADVKKLTADLFKNRLSARECIDYLCRKIKDSLKEEKLESYAKALDFVEENLFSNQLTVGAVAEYTGVSQSSLVKLFCENIGITPGDYIGKGRCEKSLDFLKENMSVENTALSVGFSSVETYIRTFKKHMGLTPGTWKKKYL